MTDLMDSLCLVIVDHQQELDNHERQLLPMVVAPKKRVACWIVDQLLLALVWAAQ